MPEEMERALRRQARLRGYGPKRTRAYVYGTMRRRGWKPKRKRRR